MAVQDPISTSQGRTGTATQAAPPTVQAGPQTLEMPPRFRQSIGPESLWPRASLRVGAVPVLALTENPGEVLLSQRRKCGISIQIPTWLLTLTWVDSYPSSASV